LSTNQMIPRKAVEPLVETCKQLSKEWRRPAPLIFESILKAMKKHSEFFFKRPLPEVKEKTYELLNEEEKEFIFQDKTFEGERERLVLVCIRRNLSLEGFDKKGFFLDYNFFGSLRCIDCKVPDAMKLREELKKHEEFTKRIEEEIRRGEPSEHARIWSEHLKKPEVRRHYKLLEVKLKLYEEDGLAEGKVCEHKNMYSCPYGEDSLKLVEEGRVVGLLWEIISWYDRDRQKHDEPKILDATDYNDIMNAFDDGRIDKIIQEFEKYKKEISPKRF